MFSVFIDFFITILVGHKISFPINKFKPNRPHIDRIESIPLFVGVFLQMFKQKEIVHTQSFNNALFFLSFLCDNWHSFNSFLCDCHNKPYHSVLLFIVCAYRA